MEPPPSSPPAPPTENVGSAGGRNPALEQSVREHFDEIAPSYDKTKRNNWYYFASLKRCVQEVIPPHSSVLDIGTGTGDVLAFLQPREAVGLDVSERMVAIAQAKYPQFSFVASSYADYHTDRVFDAILLTDVIEHVDAPAVLFHKLHELAGRDTLIVMTMANPLWEPILSVLERLHLKMEEGPHLRISEREVIALARQAGLEMVSCAGAVLLPVSLPILTWMANDVLARLPLLRNLTLIRRFVFRRATA